jgi:hypothetical protein
MEIKRGNTVIANVHLQGNSFVEEEVTGNHYIQLVFLSPSTIDLAIGDYITYSGGDYKIRNNETVKKEETSLGWSYTVTFYASQYELQDVSFFLHGAPERKKNFDYYNGTAAQWLAIIVENMNRVSSGWQAGSVIESAGINMSFRDKSCAAVLGDLVGELDTEYWITGKTINIGRREYASNGLILGQGGGLGFKDITLSAVDETPPITVLYPYGSDKNITSNYGNDYLVLPGGALSLEKNIDKYGRIEQSVQFEDIFPKGEFHVTEKIDNFTLKASDIDFNLTDCLIDGIEAIVTFQNGGLAGYDLAIVEGSWNNATKQFKLKKNEQENALNVPGDINFAVGDMFILTSINMPQSYIGEAENKLLEEATKYHDSVCEKRVQLSCVCDNTYFKTFDISISCGQMIGIISDPLGIDREIRCTKIKKYLENDREPYRYEIVVSDFLQGSGMRDLIKEVKNVPDEIQKSVNPVKEFTKRTWRDVMQTKEMLFDPESDFFTDIIQPLAVHTAQLIVGTNSQQMNLVGVKFIPNADNDPNLFKNTAGTLEHFTVNADGTIRTWGITSSTHSLDNENAYYVYARCGKGVTTGTILVTDQKILLEQEEGYYNFWIGVLNTPIDGVRSWQPMYGYTEIAGQQITTGLIKDRLARLVIDLASARIIAQNGAEIIGKLTISSGSSGYDNLEDKPDLSIYDEAVNYLDNVLPGTFEEMQRQLDKAIDSWFDHYDPAMNNFPASEWATTNDKERHLDDTFTNLDTGQSWRFTKSTGNVYSWTLMADTAASKALLLAGQAKDTADGKRRTFVATPYPPYDIGDLWTQGASGDIMRCKTARLTGSYVASDWEKASKYTDDSAATAANTKAQSALDAAIAASNAANAADSKAGTAQSTASSAQTAANSKATVFYGTNDPPSGVTGMKTNDLYVSGTLIYRYNGSSWVKADKYDVQMTITNGGAVDTGAIILGGTGGMAATGTVRIWSGGSGGSTTNGTFRVTDTGAVFARNSINVENPNSTVVCGFSSDGTTNGGSLDNPGSIRIWAGSATPSSGTFKVTQAGYVYGTQFVTNGVAGRMYSGGFEFGEYSGSGYYAALHASNNPLFRIRSQYVPLEVIYNGGQAGIAIAIKNPTGVSTPDTFQLGYFRYGSEGFGRPCIRMTRPIFSNHLSGIERHNVCWDATSGYFYVE